MNTEDELQTHRKARLQELIDHFFGGSIVALATAIQKDPSYVGRMLYPLGKKEGRAVTDRTVRLIVAALDIAPNWFDLPIGSEQLDQADGTTARVADRTAIDNATIPARSIVWPFPTVGYRRVLALRAALGKRKAHEAMRDISDHLDIVMTKWEREAERLARARVA